MLADEDFNAITALHEEWLRRERAGASESLCELCTDDVVLVPPGQPPVIGRAAVLEWLGRPGAQLISVTAEIRMLRGTRTMAFKVATFESSSRDCATGMVQTAAGSHVWVVERAETGAWRVALVSWDLYSASHEAPK